MRNGGILKIVAVGRRVSLTLIRANGERGLTDLDKGASVWLAGVHPSQEVHYQSGRHGICHFAGVLLSITPDGWERWYYCLADPGQPQRPFHGARVGTDTTRRHIGVACFVSLD